jgi:hypothetical protein
MRIWHDNTGKGEKASWFLKYIIVHDLQTKEKFYFLCQDWLALERKDGKIERELFVACEPQKTTIKYLMKKQAKHYLIDNHLWLSVFNRPIQSTFTCFDRVTCCFVFHYLSMLLNILYYDNKASVSFFPSEFSASFHLSSFNIKYEQVKQVFFYYSRASKFYRITPYRALAFFVYHLRTITNRFGHVFVSRYSFFLSNRLLDRTQNLTIENTKVYRFSLEKRNPYPFKAKTVFCFN